MNGLSVCQIRKARRARVKSPPKDDNYTKIILCINNENDRIGRRFMPNALFQVHF